MKSKVIKFLNILEGYKTRCKNLHWSAPNRGTHIYLDEFLQIISDYQDGLAEGAMGIIGPFSYDSIKGEYIDIDEAIQLALHLRAETLLFYEQIPDVTLCKGLVSECETFIQNINKYIYLFGLC